MDQYDSTPFAFVQIQKLSEIGHVERTFLTSNKVKEYLKYDIPLYHA
jgi:hypothetical protein